MENKLDCEVDGVNTGLELLDVTGAEWGLVERWWRVGLRGEGVVPYGCALLKLYAGSI